MSDPVLALVLPLVFFAAMALVRWFKTLDAGFWIAARRPVAAGIAAGAALWIVADAPVVRAILTGVLLTIAAVWVRHVGDESEAADGMLLGALSAASAAVPLAFTGHEELRQFAECVIAGTVAGYGITFAAFHVADRVRQIALDLVTAAIAVGGALLPAWLAGHGVSDRRTALIAALVIPLLGVATVFKQWPSLRAELEDEAALGVIDPEDVRPTAHPLLRLGRAGWTNLQAHREFVRLANRIALRKRHQRHRTDDTIARLYQVEILKLRTQMQQMAAIDRAAREDSSDKMVEA
jgi:hypothetical protein